MTARTYDTFHMGRAGLDLYSNDVGAAFVDITSFAAYVGGSPTNISVGARRLGLKSALLTAVGQDPVGDFILQRLVQEGVDVSASVRKPGYRTAAAVLGIEPPDRFPLVYYRDNCADVELSIDDVLAAPIAASRVFQFGGMNLSKEPCRSATMFAAELARDAGVEVVLDIDFRPDQWHDVRACGVAIRAVLPLVDIVLGTDDEINAAVLRDPAQLRLTHSQVTDARVTGDVRAAIATILAVGPRAVVEKVGSRGSIVHLAGGEVIDAAGFPVQVYNILGAGDAFAAGFLYGHAHDWGWQKAARFGNACGAIVVTRHACSASMPTFAEVMAFVEGQGGL
jgi:5-dehydro-2-deoxygluconokinase